MLEENLSLREKRRIFDIRHSNSMVGQNDTGQCPFRASDIVWCGLHLKVVKEYKALICVDSLLTIYWR